MCAAPAPHTNNSQKIIIKWKRNFIFSGRASIWFVTVHKSQQQCAHWIQYTQPVTLCHRCRDVTIRTWESVRYQEMASSERNLRSNCYYKYMENAQRKKKSHFEHINECQAFRILQSASEWEKQSNKPNSRTHTKTPHKERCDAGKERNIHGGRRCRRLLHDFVVLCFAIVCFTTHSISFLFLFYDREFPFIFFSKCKKEKKKDFVLWTFRCRAN